MMVARFFDLWKSLKASWNSPTGAALASISATWTSPTQRGARHGWPFTHVPTFLLLLFCATLFSSVLICVADVHRGMEACGVEHLATANMRQPATLRDPLPSLVFAACVLQEMSVFARMQKRLRTPGGSKHPVPPVWFAI